VNSPRDDVGRTPLKSVDMRCADMAPGVWNVDEDVVRELKVLLGNSHSIVLIHFDWVRPDEFT
jgi:hypothetical protein